MDKNQRNHLLSSIIVSSIRLRLHAESMMSNNEQQNQDTKQKYNKKQGNISEATEKDWEDFFAAQEDLDTLFDR